jgi:hypothetical protein
VVQEHAAQVQEPSASQTTTKVPTMKSVESAAIVGSV